MNHDRRSRNHWHNLASRDKAIKRDCPFCELSPYEEVVKQNSTMRVLYNRVKYDSFEGIPARAHFMIVPKNHRTKISEFTEQEKNDYLEYIEEYEDEGYSFYGRGLANGERSQPHMHTHVLELKGRRTRFLLYIRRPYFVFRGRQATARA